MRKVYATAIALAILSSCKGQQNNRVLFNPHVWYEFYNSLVPRDSVKTFYLVSKPGFYDEYTGSLFRRASLAANGITPADTAYMRKQLKASVGFNWQQDSIPGARIIPKDTINKIFSTGVDEGWDYFHKHYPASEGFDNFSVPLFSLNGQKCLTYHSNSCGGLCGTGYIDLYIKKGSKWIRVVHSMIWIS